MHLLDRVEANLVLQNDSVNVVDKSDDYTPERSTDESGEDDEEIASFEEDLDSS